LRCRNLQTSNEKEEARSCTGMKFGMNKKEILALMRL
jgi:hypothetical protein